MPTYDYVCEACGHAFEHFQSMTDRHLRTCPKCGRKRLLRKVGAGAGVIFKGSGFYQTDYKAPEAGAKAKQESKESGGGSNEGKGEEKGGSAEGAKEAGPSKPAAGASDAASKPAAAPKDGGHGRSGGGSKGEKGGKGGKR